MPQLKKHESELSDYDATLFLGLTARDLSPILEEAVGASIESFTVQMDHERPEPYGYQAEKAIPTFDYVTKNGDSGQITMFVKRFHRSGLAESQQYRYLAIHDAPIPRMYGTFLDLECREFLFLEYVTTPRPVGTMKELLSTMAQFHAIRPSTEYRCWLEQASSRFHNRLASAESALNLIWEHAVNDELGSDLAGFCSSNPQALSRIQKLVRHVMDKCHQMSQGLIHTDFSRENLGRRQDELVIMDLEWVSLGPRFFDVAGWLGKPADTCPPDARQLDLAQHFLGEYARFGGTPPSTEEFFDDLRTLWLANILRYFDWNLKRALGGWEASPADDDERHACCEHLFRTLTMFAND